MEGGNFILPVTFSLGKAVTGIEKNLTHVILWLCMKRGNHVTDPHTYAYFGSSGLVSGPGPHTERAPCLAYGLLSSSGGCHFLTICLLFYFALCPADSAPAPVLPGHC